MSEIQRNRIDYYDHWTPYNMWSNTPTIITSSNFQPRRLVIIFFLQALQTVWNLETTLIGIRFFCPLHLKLQLAIFAILIWYRKKKTPQLIWFLISMSTPRRSNNHQFFKTIHTNCHYWQVQMHPTMKSTLKLLTRKNSPRLKEKSKYMPDYKKKIKEF